MMTKNIVIGILIVIILVTWSGLLWKGNNLEQVQQSQQTQIAKVTDEKGALQKNFDDALVRLDSLTGTNNRLQSQLSEANTDVAKKKAEIRRLLVKRNVVMVSASENIYHYKPYIDKVVIPNSIKIPVFYGTDRLSTGSTDPNKYFSGKIDRNKPYQVGIVEVSIPIQKHVIGELDLPSWYNFFADSRDTTKYFVIKGLHVLNYYNFFSELKRAVQESGNKDLFVFIHGYNNTFIQAAERTAQLAYDLGFKGAPILYSWSSGGTLQGYLGDEENVRLTVKNLKQFLLDIIDKTHAKKINLIGHSMGTRALTSVLNEITIERGTIFNEVILAAADINADEFRYNIAPNMISKCNRITIYSSSKDEALMTSKNIHSDHFRVGEGGNHIFTMPGMQTVDASGLKCDDFFNHSYFLESRPLIDDIRQLFIFDANPEDRNLIEIQDSCGRYWSFKK